MRRRVERNGVVSAGKSNRDLTTLAYALSRTDATGVIYDLVGELSDAPNDAVRLIRPGGVDGVDPEAPGQYLASRVLNDIAAAAVVAVPVRDPRRLTGLAETVDALALALARPVVATRSPYFPFDVEQIGCGILVELGDQDGWRRALAQLLSDDEARSQMGPAGRAFAERLWNYERFCDGLRDLIYK